MPPLRVDRGNTNVTPLAAKQFRFAATEDFAASDNLISILLI